MKKLSKQWKELCQIIDIINIRISKEQRKLIKFKRNKQELMIKIHTQWEMIEQEQRLLKTLNVQSESNSLERLFLRREDCKSHIESFFFDVSIMQQKVEKLALEINESEMKKKQLEMRKNALDELRELVINE